MNIFKRILTILLSIAIVLTSVPFVYAQEDQSAEQPSEHIHSYTSETIKEATHISHGTIRYTCSCGDWYDEIIFSPGHSYEKKVLIETTHENDGLIRYECSCGDWYEETEVSPGHTYLSKIISHETHETDGLILNACSCGDKYEVIIPAVGHEYVPTIFEAASHAKDGILRYICSCGASYDEIIPGEDHVYENVIIQPTCTDNGLEVERCKICNHEIVIRDPEKDPNTDDLIALGHNYEVINHVDPTQEIDGFTDYKCSRCGDTYTAVLEHDDKFVAEMYICAKQMVSPLGHIWVYIQNKSDHDLTVGAYTLPTGQGVSIGAYGLTRVDGAGIYYNVESYLANKNGYPSVICMQEKLTESELNSVSKKIAKSNYWDLLIFNCMGIAFSIWNSGSASKLIPLILPVFGRLQILLHPHEDEIDMYYPTENQVYKQRGSGDKAYLEKVSRQTLANGI